MSKFEGVSTEELEKRINERQQFLEKVIAFVAEVTQEIGELKEFSEQSSYSTWTRELTDFGGFSFRHRSSWGTDESTVWYHPQLAAIKLDLALPVLRVDAKDNKGNCEVEIFNEKKEWQEALSKVIECRDEITAHIKKEEEKRQENLRLQTAEERKRAELLKVAERLKL